MQVAFAHLLFNVSGILLFYPLPFMRAIPPKLAKKLGNITADYRWFAIAYLVFFYFLFPALILALSIAGWQYLAAVLTIVALIIVFLISVHCIRARCPQRLPKRLQTWDWCPTFLCSLKPYDKLMKKTCCRCCKCKMCQDFEEEVVDSFEVDFNDVNSDHDVPVVMKNGNFVPVKRNDNTDVVVSKVQDDTAFTNPAFDEREETQL